MIQEESLRTDGRNISFTNKRPERRSEQDAAKLDWLAAAERRENVIEGAGCYCLGNTVNEIP